MFGYVPDPHSIYQGVCKLPPGNIATIDLAGDVTIKPYWELDHYVFDNDRRAKILPFSDVEVIERAHELVRDSVSRRMMAYASRCVSFRGSDPNGGGHCQ